MSSTFSELAAEAVIETLSAQPFGGRFLVVNLHGEPIADAFREVLARSTGRRPFPVGPPQAPSTDLAILDGGDGIIVVPYLVVEPPPTNPRENRGGQGFVGALRDHFDAQADADETVFLLTFDEAPNETELTTMDQGVLSAALELPELLTRALRPRATSGSSALARTLRELSAMPQVLESEKLTPQAVAETAQAVEILEALQGLTALGQGLAALPWCLSDPRLFEYAGQSFQDRLRRAVALRLQLERWARDPSTDFDRAVRAQFSEAAAHEVSQARVGSEIDWSAFTLDDLESGKAVKPDPADPPQFGPVPVEVASAWHAKRLRDGEALAAHVHGPEVGLAFRLRRPLKGDETLHVFGFDGSEPPYKRRVLATAGAAANAGREIELRIDAPPQARDGWSFLLAALTSGKRMVKAPADTVDIVLSFGSADEPLVYEIEGKVNFEAQAYAGEERLTAVAEKGGEQIAATEIEVGSEEYGELLDVGSGLTLPGAAADLSETSGASATTSSPEHLAVDAWAAGRLVGENFTPALRKRPAGVVADIGTESRPFASHDAPFDRRWAYERFIIENPDVTTFSVVSGAMPEPHSRINALQLGPLDAPFSAFAEARRAFFEVLGSREVPSLLGLSLSEVPAAQAYVDAYASLLAAIPDGALGHLGYDRILLVDCILVEGTSRVLVAPTNPLTVAFQLKFQRRVGEWIALPPTKNYFSGDVASVTPRHLVPYLKLNAQSDSWLESGYAPYPWRSYAPLTEPELGDRHPSTPGYIARRIERFLDVHPSYADRRRTLRVGFVNPGAAEHVRDALLLLVERYLQRPNDAPLEALPSFELQLLSDGPRPGRRDQTGSSLDLFMGLTTEDGQRSDAATEVMKRLRYTKGSAATFLGDPKAFVHLAFVEDFFRPSPGLVEWPTGAHAQSMYGGGLAADVERLVKVQPSAKTFVSATWPPEVNANQLETIAARITEITAAAAGVPVKRGVVRAAEVVIADTVIPQLYERAVWVTHMDRHVGLELFASVGTGSSSPYVLDYTDQETPEPGVLDGVTATSQVGPYLARIVEVFGTATQQAVSPSAAERLLRTLNVISGRWGLELLSTSANVLRGRLATALAAQVLNEAEGATVGADTLRVVIALDELLRVSGGEGLPTKEGWVHRTGGAGRASDDLLIMHVPLADARPVIKARIVEVKYRSDIATSVEEAANQVRATFNLLSEILVAEAQPGRMFQGRRLAKLVGRYAGRYSAYGTGGNRSVGDPAVALDRLASGEFKLELEFERHGESLIGDYVSVEPTRTDAAILAENYASGDTRIGRIRIGQSALKAMLSPTSQPVVLGPRDEPPIATTSTVDGLAPARFPEENGGEGVGSSGVPEDEPEVVVQATGPEVEPGVGGSAAVRAAPEPEGPSFAMALTDLRRLSDRLDDVLSSYRLPIQPVDIANAVCGPNTVRFAVRMARGGTIAQVEARSRDIMRELGVSRPIMIGQADGFLTLDIPRSDPVVVEYSDLAPALLSTERARGELPVIFGVDLAGNPRVEDLAQLPHLLIAGSTGSGKSVFLTSLLASLAALPPEEVEIVLVDVKGLDFAPFAGLPHLRRPIIGSAQEALETLDEVYETERAERREVLAAAGAQSILDYFTRLQGKDLRQIVIVIDEFSNLLGGDKATGSSLEDTIQQYAEIMRSFGVYLVIATQRPSADIVTGRIKANLPARCAFRLPTHHDSTTILGRKGAEQLLGRGDMLFYREGDVERLQAPRTVAADVLDAARVHE